jgi:hypothetical protein
VVGVVVEETRQTEMWVEQVDLAVVVEAVALVGLAVLAALEILHLPLLHKDQTAAQET